MPRLFGRASRSKNEASESSRKISQLIKILEKAKSDFGDVEAKLMDSESGDWNAIKTVLKLHPYTLPHGWMNRAEAVDAIAFTCKKGETKDLILGESNFQ